MSNVEISASARVVQLDAILSLLLRGSDNDLWKTACFLRARTWTPQGVGIHSLFNISVNRAFNSHWKVCFVYFTFFSLKIFCLFSAFWHPVKLEWCAPDLSVSDVPRWLI